MAAKRWAYHVTAEGSALRGIARHGLLPAGSDRTDPADLSAVWFTSANYVDKGYGDVVIRFPYPKERAHLGEGDNYLERPVPVEQIQVLTRDDGWVDLTSALHYHMPIFNIDDTAMQQFPGLERRRRRARRVRLRPAWTGRAR